MRHTIRKFGAVIFVWLAFSTTAIANGENVQVLLRKCTEAKDSGDSWFCFGRVTGIFEMMGIIGVGVGKQISTMKMWEVCADPTPSHGAQVQAFINWANKHPENWSQVDIIGVVLAMSETWPCR